VIVIRYLVDTGFFVAFLNVDDTHHEEEISENIIGIKDVDILNKV